jgi:hypothetical protein
MPAKSKQQQKFFGVVKAMQAGDLPKKGAAGKVAKDMSKKEVDKYASTKHKGLPKKVKKETMKIADIKKMVDEELKYVLENLNDPILKKLRTLPKGNLLPPLNKWWEAQPEDLLSAIYWSKGQLPPREPAKFEKAYNDIVKQLHVKYPIPAELLDTIDVDDETERALSVDAPDMMEAKMTPAKVQKAQRELVATIDLLKKNFPMYKKAKESGDDKKLAKHRDIAVKLTKKKKQLELDLDKALGGLYQDAELELKEAVYDDMLKAVPDNYSYKNLAADVANIIKNEYGSHNIKPFIQELSKMLKEGKLNEALPKFKTPVEAFKWIMDKRGDGMEIEDEMRDVSKDIQQLYRKMEQEAEPGGGPIADRYGEELESLEMHHKQLRAEFQKIMDEIDEYDQNY